LNLPADLAALEFGGVAGALLTDGWVEVVPVAEMAASEVAAVGRFAKGDEVRLDKFKLWRTVDGQDVVDFQTVSGSAPGAGWLYR